jgi:hypothetical protein
LDASLTKSSLIYLTSKARLRLSHPVREIVWLRRLSTPSDHPPVSTTDQVPARSPMGHCPARTHTSHLPERRHTDHLPAPREAPLTCLDERAGKALGLSQIASVLAKSFFFALVVAVLGGCSSMVYAPKAAVRTGTVRTSTLKQICSVRSSTFLQRMSRRRANSLSRRISELM